ncbi:adenylate/guanylate cyclase domain-containing protein [Actinacidiphila epipremni]|uniref:Adenylate/guanylate cyclase domain-containing protein n=1 Tax=Actinacidiphila epipremni TaxID=2053013 RepID=A0ABX0ZIS7_9ACTN|nr:adenylate/guanylate cyclase domain-containing protein [Actinacidiphila epipremni]NJP42671.1 adenylate/guanylate cyclase domain-containing protein [Actinacidiphila epipremni]
MSASGSAGEPGERPPDPARAGDPAGAPGSTGAGESGDDPPAGRGRPGGDDGPADAAAAGGRAPESAQGAEPARAGEPAPGGEAGQGAEAAPGGDPAPGGGDEAEAGGEHPLALRLEQLILGAPRQYTPFQAARTAGVSMDLASRFWRAMGFADIGQAKALTEADVLALRRLAGLVEAGLLSESMAIQVARSTGQTTARLADWQTDSFLEGLTEPPEPGMTRAEVAYPLVELLLPELEEFLIYVWRRQVAAATSRVVQSDDEEAVDRRLAVGFADLVGFTRLTRRLEEEELGELVEAFETTAADQVAAYGGRLIKTLGDEVLFVADDPGTAAEIGMRLIETMTGDESMPALRVGMAFGTVTTRMGDVFGTTVNLASRLTSIAPRDSVLVDGDFAEALGEAGEAPLSEADVEAADAEKYRFALQPMWRRPVRGLGVVEPWLLTRR